MKKRVVLILIVFMSFIGFAGALFHNSETNTTNSSVIRNASSSANINDKEGVDKAYACLENEVEKKSSLSLQLCSL